jgi:hypothetical protein
VWQRNGVPIVKKREGHPSLAEAPTVVSLRSPPPNLEIESLGAQRETVLATEKNSADGYVSAAPCRLAFLWHAARESQRLPNSVKQLKRVDVPMPSVRSLS